MLKKISAIVFSVFVLFVGSANAESVAGVPTAWRLQNIVNATPNYVSTYFTGSSCANGLLAFDTQASPESVNRYWSLVMTAKVAKQPIRVYYSVTGGQCIITSFLLAEE